MFVASYLASCAASAAGYCACWTASGCTKAMMKRSARVAYRWVLLLSSGLAMTYAGCMPRCRANVMCFPVSVFCAASCSSWLSSSRGSCETLPGRCWKRFHVRGSSRPVLASWVSATMAWCLFNVAHAHTQRCSPVRISSLLMIRNETCSCSWHVALCVGMCWK